MKAEIKRELDRLKAEARNGLLTKHDVVAAARDVHNPLHSWHGWTWDRNDAYEKNLLREAGELIGAYVEIIHQGSSDPVLVRHFVSLRSDRVRGGGYRTVVDVLDDRELAVEMLNDALAELEVVQSKYGKLEALAGVFREIEKARERAGTSRKNPRRGQAEARA